MIPCTPYDPADARKLVAKSGISNPTVHLLTANTTDRLNLAQFIQAEEAAVGINVAIDSTDNVTAGARAHAGNFDVYVFGHTSSGPDPSLNFNDLETTDGTNYGGYSNPRLDYVLANGLKATEFKARVVNYRVAAQIVQADRPVIPLYHLTTYAAFGTERHRRRAGPGVGGHPGRLRAGHLAPADPIRKPALRPCGPGEIALELEQLERGCEGRVGLRGQPGRQLDFGEHELHRSPSPRGSAGWPLPPAAACSASGSASGRPFVGSEPGTNRARLGS